MVVHGSLLVFMIVVHYFTFCIVGLSKQDITSKELCAEWGIDPCADAKPY